MYLRQSMKRLQNILIGVLCCTLFHGIAQEVPKHLRFFGLESGIPSLRVNCIAEDSTGFIWVGTEEGLARFDGVHFKNFRVENSAIQADNIYVLYHMGDDLLLVGAYPGGLSLFNTQSQEFTPIESLVGADGRPMSSVMCISEESDSTLLIGFENSLNYEGGIARLNRKTLSLERCYRQIDNVTSIALSPQGDLWVTNDSLYYFRNQVETDIHEIDSPYRGTRNMPYYRQAAFVGDSVLIATQGDGIHIYDQSKNAFVGQVLPMVEGRTMVNNRIEGFFETTSKGTWFYSGDLGAGHFDFASGKLRFIERDERYQAGLEGNTFKQIFKCSRGVTWFATRSGLANFTGNDFQVDYHDLSEHIEKPDIHLMIIRVVETPSKLVVSVSRSEDYLVLDKDDFSYEGSFSVNVELDQLRRLNPDLVDLSNNGEVLLGGVNAVYSCDPELGVIEKVLDVESLFQTEYNSLVSMTVGQNQDLWIGGVDNLLGRYDLGTKTMKSWWLVGDTVARIQVDSVDVGFRRTNRIVSVAPKAEDGAFVAAYYGVFDVSDTSITRVSERCEECDIFDRSTYGTLALTRGRLVYATHKMGVAVLDLERSKLKIYDRSDGMPSIRVHDMVVDKDGVIWCVGPNGLFSIDERQDRPVQSFGSVFGLPYQDLSYHKLSLGANDDIYIGFRRGVGRVKRESLRPQPVPEKVVVDEIRAGGKALLPDENGTIEVAFGQGLEIAVSALGFIEPTIYRYSWRLVGQEEWNEVERPRVFFSSVGEGDFSIEFRSGNATGQWQDQTLQLHVKAHTPFLKSKWFFRLLIALFVVFVLLFYQFRLSRIKQRELLKREYNQRIVELELQALRAQMNPHFLFNTLNSIKFFIINNDSESAADYLTKFSRLIRLILANSKIDKVTLTTELDSLRLYSELEALRFEHHFDFRIEVSEEIDPDFIELPPMIIQPFVENAIWHGLMHKSGRGCLQVRIHLEEECLVCEIEDNGIGRQKAAELKSKSATKRKSLGVDITRDRLQRLFDVNAKDRFLEVIDLKDDEGNATGTLVRLRIPVDL